MKKYFAILVFAFWIFQLKAQNCQKVFVSEVIFSKDSTNTLIGSTFWIENYALELYNPTTSDIDLSQYSIHLMSQLGNPTIINLSDTIKAESTYVIAKSGAVQALTSVSEITTNLLDYDNYVSIEIWGNGVLLDKVGEMGLIMPDSIDLVQAMANPANYLNNLDIDLGSIEHLVLRRNPMIGQGNLTFDSLSKEWYVLPNGDYSDIDKHTNICKQTDVIVEFAQELYYANEGSVVYPQLIFHNFDSLTSLPVTVSVGQMWTPPYVISFPNYANANEISPTLCVTETPFGVLPIFPEYDNTVEPDEVMMYQIVSVWNAKVNPAKKHTTIIIQGNSSKNNSIMGIENTQKNEVTIYPNPSKDVIYLVSINNILINKVVIYNAIGQKIINIETPYKEIDISNLSIGYYILEVYQNEFISKIPLIKAN